MPLQEEFFFFFFFFLNPPYFFFKVCNLIRFLFIYLFSLEANYFMPSNNLILCCPLLLPPSTFPSIRVFSSVFHIRWSKYWSFNLSMSPLHEYSGLISFRIDWLDLAVQGSCKKSSPVPQFKSMNS